MSHSAISNSPAPRPVSPARPVRQVSPEPGGMPERRGGGGGFADLLRDAVRAGTPADEPATPDRPARSRPDDPTPEPAASAAPPPPEPDAPPEESSCAAPDDGATAGASAGGAGHAVAGRRPGRVGAGDPGHAEPGLRGTPGRRFADTLEAVGATGPDRAGQAGEARGDEVDRSRPAAAAEPFTLASPASTAQAAPGGASAEGGLAALAEAGPAGSAEAPAPAAPEAPAPPPTQARLDPPPGTPAFNEALGAQLHTWLRDGVEYATLELNPQDMGPIDVRIALVGGRTEIQLAADVASTRAALQEALPGLAGALEDVGLQLAGGSVGDQTGRHAAERDAQARRGFALPGWLEPAGAEGPAPAGGGARAARRGLVDLMA